MDEIEARKILGEDIQSDNSLHNSINYLDYNQSTNSSTAVLDGDFTADELEAIAWWMKNKHVIE